MATTSVSSSFVPLAASACVAVSPSLLHHRLRCSGQLDTGFVFRNKGIRGVNWSRRSVVVVRGSVGAEEEEVAMGHKEANWVEFPKLSPAGKHLMETVAGMMDKDLADLINPSETDPDVRSFKGGNGEGSVTLRAGRAGSKIDFVLGSWLNCTLPFGTLNIATLIAMLGPEADSPHLLFEFIQSGPDNLVLVLDLLPRKDLVLNPEYLARYYEQSGLEALRQTFEQHPQTQPFLTSALYVRSVVSPTALLYKVSGEGVEGGIDSVIADLVEPTAVKVFQTWVDSYKNLGQAMDSDAVAYMKNRDDLIKTKGVEVDLSSNMPRLFGQEIADRVVAAFRKGV